MGWDDFMYDVIFMRSTYCNAFYITPLLCGILYDNLLQCPLQILKLR